MGTNIKSTARNGRVMVSQYYLGNSHGVLHYDHHEIELPSNCVIVQTETNEEG